VVETNVWRREEEDEEEACSVIWKMGCDMRSVLFVAPALRLLVVFHIIRLLYFLIATSINMP
jgi:hypothetical protein